MADTAKTDKDLEKLSFEDALKELEGIVQQLEAGKVKLDEAIAIYERGTKLKDFCERKLKEARARIEKITISPEGKVGAEPAGLD